MFKHAFAANHTTGTSDDFTVLISGLPNRKFKRKISESLFIKQQASIKQAWHLRSFEVVLSYSVNFEVIQNLVKCLRWSFLQKS